MADSRNFTWRCHDAEMLSALLAPYQVDPLVTGGFPSKCQCWDVFVDTPNKPSYRQFEGP